MNANLTALLAAQPSRAVWRQIMGELLHAPAGEVEQLLARVEQAVSDWPDELRTLTPALARRLGSPFPPALRLLRGLDTLRHGHGLHDAPDVERFFREVGFTRLHVFRLRYAPFGDEGAEIIARQDLGLRELTLGNCQIGNAGAIALASSPNLRELRALSLFSNQIGGEGARASAESSVLTRLERLNLYGNETPRDVMTEIGAVLKARGCRLIAHGNFGSRRYW